MEDQIGREILLDDLSTQTSEPPDAEADYKSQSALECQHPIKEPMVIFFFFVFFLLITMKIFFSSMQMFCVHYDPFMVMID